MKPIARPSITEKEIQYVNDALINTEIGVGKYIKLFEDSWADYNMYAHALACNSGTSALFLALKGLGIGEGDEVIVPNFTMIACAWAVTYTGAKPIFVDCGEDLNIDPLKIEKKITSKTKAIMAVHIYGRRCDMESIMSIAKKHNLKVIEDLAEAHGIHPIADMACYSFYGSKILTTGEGGMVLTDDKEALEEMRRYANLYFDKDRTMIHQKIGYNFRMTNIQAAIGYAQVTRIEELLDKRDQIQEWYDRHIGHLSIPRSEESVLWYYDIIFPNQGERDKCIERLNKAEIGWRYFFKPMNMQPMYLEDNYKDSKAYDFSTRGIYLPVYHDMTEEEVINICKIINEYTTIR